MLILYDINHNKIAGLKNYKEYKIEREINKLDILSFLYPVNDRNHNSIIHEGYIRTKENEYVVKEKNYSDENYDQYVCKINIEDIQGTPVSHFETVEQTCTNAVNLALAGTGWTIGTCNVTKKRTTRKNNCSAYDVLVEIQTAYKCEMTFDAINKKVYIYQSQGSDKGVYFSDQLNLKKVDTQSDSYDYVTRLIPRGKDNLDIKDVNGGKEYVENYQYSNKIITAYWEDNRYAVAQNLKDDAVERLDYLSKPLRAYKADVYDLANLNDKYKNILDYSLGDTITFLSKERNVKEKQRIVKLVEYPDEPERNTVEIANKIASLDALNVRFQNTSDTVDSVTTSAGMIDGNKIDAIDWDNIEHVHIAMADIEELNATIANIGTLIATKATITDLTTINANITNLQADKANITDLTATNANITNLNADVAAIQTLVAGNITSANMAVGAIAAGNAVIANGAIGDAMIASLSVSKLLAGNISTNKIVVQSDSGNLKIQDNTLHVWDDNGKERVSLGKNEDDYNLLIRGADGDTVLFGIDGVTRAGITEGAIDDSKVDVNANINAGKINIDSMFSAMNENTNTLKASKIKFDDTGQTLDVSFTSLSNTVSSTSTTVSSQGTSISTMQGYFNAKVWSTDITTAADNISIGGENLLQNSGKFSTLANWFSDDMINMDIAIDFPYLNITKISGTNLTIYNDSLGKITWDTTSDYMITMVIKSTGSVDFNFSIASKDGSKVVKPPIDNVNVNNQEITVSYKFKPAIVNNSDMNLFLYLANMSNGTIFSIKTIMLEKGNKASDWSPSGLELRTGIENINDEVSYVNTRVAAAEIKLTDDSIVSTVTNSSTYVANQESIDNKITSLTSTVNENRSYIIQLSDAITFKVSYESFESYQTTTNGYISNLTDTMYTKASNDDLATTNGYITALTTRVSTAESSISTLADIITLKVTKTDFESYQTTTNGYISDLTNNKANGSDLETTNGYIEALTTRTSTAESSITALSSSVALKVNTTDFESYQTTTNGYLTGLTTRVSNAESSITAMNDSIILKVSTSDFESYQTTTNGFLTSLTNGKANSTDLESTNNNLGDLTSRVSTAESSITALSSSIVLKVSNTDFETYKTTTNGYITNLTNAMYNKASYDDLDTTNGYIEALTTRVETAESSITAMNNNINLKVSTSTFESYQTFNNGNVSSLTTRVESAESSIDILSDSITSKVDVNGVKSIIEQGASQIQTAFDGLTGNFVIKNGHLVLKNSSDTNVMWVDSPTGRLTCNSLDVYGEGSNTIYFHGNGSKRVQIQSDNGGTCLLAFRSNNYGLASQADILSYTDAQPLGNLFFQPRDYLVIRSSGSTPEVNKPVHLSMWGDIELNGGTYLNDDGHVGSSWNGTTTNGNITIGGTLNVAGAKHKIVKTSSGAVYAMNAVESPDCLFIVRGRGKLLKGECRIEFEEKWLQVVNTELGYDIVPIPYGDGNVYADLDTMTKTGFTMKGDNDINFGFIVFAKQIGCEDVYMEKIMVSDEFYRNMK